MQYIGVIRLDRLGDTVLTLPAIKIIKKNYPHHKIVGIFNPYNSELFIYQNEIIHPYFDIIEIIPVNIYYEKHLFLEVVNYLKIIFWEKRKKYFFDKLFVFSPTTLSYLLGSILKAGKKYTYFYASRFNKEFFKKNFIHYIDPVDKSIDSEYDVRHEVYQNLEVVKLDVDFEFEKIDKYIPEIFLPQIEFENYDLLIFDKELFFSDKLGIEWLKTFVKTVFEEVKNLTKNKLKIGFVSKRKDIFDFAINTPTVIELMGLIKNAKFIICFDSGIVHIASAFNKNLIAIFTNKYFEFDVKRWAPLSASYKILKLDIYNDNHMLDFELTNPIEYAKYVVFYAKEYI